MPIWNGVISYDLRVHEMKEAAVGALHQRPDPARGRQRALPAQGRTSSTSCRPPSARTTPKVLVGPVVRSEARKVFGRYQPEEIYSTQREEIERQIYDEVLKALAGKHVVVEAMLVRDVELPETIKIAIADKLAEEQRSQKMKFTLDKERQEAQRKQIEAEGIAKYQIIVRQGLTPEYLQYKGIEATEKLAPSPNAKIVMVGSAKSGLPLVFQVDK